MATTRQLLAVCSVCLGMAAAAGAARADDRARVAEKIGTDLVKGAHYSAKNVRLVDYRTEGNSLHITMTWDGTFFRGYKSEIRLDVSRDGIERYEYSDTAKIPWSGRSVRAAVDSYNRLFRR